MFSRNDEKPERKSDKGAIKTTEVVRDRSIILPTQYKNTKKDICKIIRKAFSFSKDEDINDEVQRYCNYDEIYKELFEDSENLEYMTIRLYIR
jgi:hypothetical protein